MEKIIYYYDISKIGKDFVGKKDISIITNEQALLESVINILSTEPGERIMNPEFGCPLHRFIFEPLDNITATQIESAIIDSIQKFESRIDKLNVFISTNDNTNTFDISVIFTMKTSSQTQTINITLNKIR
jgi:hypothetical protein